MLFSPKITSTFYRVGEPVSIKPYMKKISFQYRSVLFSQKITSLRRPITLRYQQDTYIFWKLRLFFKCFIFRHTWSEYGNLLKMMIFCRSQNRELGICKHSSLNNLTSTADNFTCMHATNKILIYSESWDSSLNVLFSGLND